VLKRLNQVVDLLLSFGGSLQVVSSPARKPPILSAHLQEDVQLLSDVVNRGNLGFCFLYEVILLLLELFSPFLKPTDLRVRTPPGEKNGKAGTFVVRRVQSSTG
jgi:hypothetical protein